MVFNQINHSLTQYAFRQKTGKPRNKRKREGKHISSSFLGKSAHCTKFSPLCTGSSSTPTLRSNFHQDFHNLRTQFRKLHLKHMQLLFIIFLFCFVSYLVRHANWHKMSRDDLKEKLNKHIASLWTKLQISIKITLWRLLEITKKIYPQVTRR